MSVAVSISWDPEAGVTEDDYWAITDKIGASEHLPAGCRHHIAGLDPQKGFMVLEEWESEEAFGRFAQEQLAPASQALGVSPPSNVTIMPLIRSLPRT